MKRFLPGIILGGLPLAVTLLIWSQREYFRPNGIEWVALACCAAIYVIGGILLLRETRREPWRQKRTREETEAERRYLQKAHEADSRRY